ARDEGKPVFISIGYSTCHWCHVMAHESFEDEEVARVINRHFIAIKIDREERPDLDNTYMAVCQMMTGSGGWPLNLALTPEKKPFFAATYIPRTPRMGMAGLITLLEKIAELWLTDRARLLQTGEEVQQALLRLDQGGTTRRPLSDTPLQNAFEQYVQTFDRDDAGFGNAPKFPAPHNLSLLLRIWQRLDEEKARTMALQTLQHLRLGGIFDQIGFGLHRYSVDARWLVPHFEKMLYDQALAASAYIDAWLVTQDSFYAQAAREILAYVLRDLGHPEGGFYCGEDADSEGAEGTFYLWSQAQVMEILGKELGTVFCRSYDISEGGNFEGKSIPHLEEDIATLAKRVGVDPGHLADLLAEGRRQLFAARQKRERPHRDDKIIAGWNGLAIAALARTGTALNEGELIEAASRAADFVLANLRRTDGRLLRRWRLGEAAIPAFLEDYAFLGWGLTELFLAGFESHYLESARGLTESMLELFDDGQGGLFDTGADAETVLIRGRSLQDGAIPSGTSVAALNLLRLGRLTGNTVMEARGEEMLAASLDQVNRYPAAYAQLLVALDYALGPKTEVILVPGADGNPPQKFLAELRRHFLPRTQAIVYGAGDTQLEHLAPIVQGKGPVEGQATAWVCRDQTCLPPVTTPEGLSTLLAKTP
ncbi:MAG TPA: thioredoxin domain-containing protein, partial [Desulfuromonadales bacterium]